MRNVTTIIVTIFICALAAAQIVYADEEQIVESKPKSEKKSKGDESGAKSENSKKEGSDFRLSGILETGFDINRRVNNDRTDSRPIARGEIEISARPARRVRAEIGIEYDMRDTFVTVDKFYAQYSLPGNGMIRAGIMKKAFGLEERAGADERYFHRRSEINNELEDLGFDDGVGFLGHDLTLMYRHDLGTDWRFVGAFSWSVEDSLLYFQNYSAQYGKDSLLVVLAAIIRHRVPGEGKTTTTFASSLSLRYALKNIISEAELTLATHPWFLLRFDHDSYIYGFRLQEQFPISVNTKTLRQIIPLAEIALLYRDDTDSRSLSFNGKGDLVTVKQLDTQIRAGLTLGFAKDSKFQWRNTFGTIMRTRDGETETRRYRFDTQAVVIF